MKKNNGMLLTIYLVAMLSFVGCSKDGLTPEVIREEVKEEENLNPLGRTLKDSENDEFRLFTLKVGKSELTNPPLEVTWIPGFDNTPTPMSFEFKNEDMVCVYSINSRNEVLCIDTCQVFGKNTIQAEVRGDAVGYIMAYPYNYFDWKLNDVIDVPNGDRRYAGSVNIKTQPLTTKLTTVVGASILTSFYAKEDTSKEAEFFIRNAYIKFRHYYSFPVTIGIYYLKHKGDNEIAKQSRITIKSEDELDSRSLDIYIPVEVGYYIASFSCWNMYISLNHDTCSGYTYICDPRDS